MAVRTPIYLDNNATTCVDPRVLEAMLPYLREHFGNPASRSHAFGRKAEDAVENARRQVAALINAEPREVIFTSGATESDNLAIKGVAEMCRSAVSSRSNRDRGGHIVTCAAEHRAVLDTCEHLAARGWDVTFLPTDACGLVSPEQVAAAITDRTVLVTIMTANNETGTIHPIAEIGAVTRQRGVLLHTDAAQAAGKIPVDVRAMGVDLMSVSAHKIYGPKGVAALYVRRKDPRVRLATQVHGGGHERQMRSGTLNVPGIVGLGAAAAIARREMPAEAPRLARLRDRLHEGITAALDHCRLNGHPTRRLPNTLNLAFAYVEGESLMMRMSDLAVSSASACGSASPEPSHVLKAMGLDDDLARGSIRFSLGRFNTPEEIDYAVGQVAQAVKDLRRLSPLYEGDPAALYCGGEPQPGRDQGPPAGAAARPDQGKR